MNVKCIIWGGWSLNSRRVLPNYISIDKISMFKSKWMWRLFPDLQAVSSVSRGQSASVQSSEAVCSASRSWGGKESQPSALTLLLTSGPRNILSSARLWTSSPTLFRPSTSECAGYPEPYSCAALASAFKRIGSPGTSNPTAKAPHCVCNLFVKY